MNQQQWNGRKKNSRWISRRSGMIALFAVSAILLTFGIIGITGYLSDLESSRNTSKEMRAIYDAAVTEAPTAGEEQTQTAAVPQDTKFPEASASADDSNASVAAEGNIPREPGTEAAHALTGQLAEIAYPDNPEKKVSARFQALQQKNPDIVGWLNIGSMLDEAVVQRDNEYYMKHSAAGKPNSNGAIFLDAMVSLQTRPRSLVLYGHNMKSGAMFGCLRNFENSTFYHSYPFITFNSLYEEGCYVVFAAGTISTDESRPDFMDFFALYSLNIPERMQAIETLRAVSVHTCTVDVQAEDQLLLLVTCVDYDDERRVVAARRFRQGETEEGLLAQVGMSCRK